MRPLVTELLARMEAGEDIEAIVQSLERPAPALLSPCAVVRTFDRELVDKVLRFHVVAGATSASFEELIKHGDVEQVLTVQGVYRVRERARRERLKSWVRDGGSAFPADLRALAATWSVTTSRCNRCPSWRCSVIW